MTPKIVVVNGGGTGAGKKERSGGVTAGIALGTSLIALATSIGGLSITLIEFMRGPDVRLIPPEQMLIRPRLHGGTTNMQFNLGVGLFNDGAPKYSDVVSREWLLFFLGDRRYEYRWQKQEHTFLNSTNDRLETTEKDDTGPLLLKGQETAWAEINFQPAAPSLVATGHVSNAIMPTEFFAAIGNGGDFTMILGVATLDDRLESIECRVSVTSNSVAAIRDRGWATVPVIPVASVARSRGWWRMRETAFFFEHSLGGYRRVPIADRQSASPLLTQPLATNH